MLIFLFFLNLGQNVKFCRTFKYLPCFFFQNEKGESEMTSIEFETKQVSHEIGEKLVLPAQPDKGIQVR